MKENEGVKYVVSFRKMILIIIFLEKVKLNKILC